MRVLVTGATGFIGSELVRTLLLRSDVTSITILVRPHSTATAAERWAKVVTHWQRFAPAMPSGLDRVVVVGCDLSKPECLSDEVIAQIQSTAPEYFIHSAASTDFHLSLEDARQANLYTTQRAINLARRIATLNRFVYMSTAFVAGKERGKILVDRVAKRFANTYEKTKLEAEQCVKVSGLPWTILRPSIVVGHSQNGYVWRMKVIYSVLKVWIGGFVPYAPVDSRAFADIIPVDYVTNATIKLMMNPETFRNTYHLCAGDRAPKSLAILRCAANVFGVKRVRTAPLWYANFLARIPIAALLIGDRLASVLEAMRWHLPYLGSRNRVFETDSTVALLGNSVAAATNFESYGQILFGFCKLTNWGKRPLAEREAQSVFDRSVG